MQLRYNKTVPFTKKMQQNSGSLNLNHFLVPCWTDGAGGEGARVQFMWVDCFFMSDCKQEVLGLQQNPRPETSRPGPAS